MYFDGDCYGWFYVGVCVGWSDDLNFSIVKTAYTPPSPILSFAPSKQTVTNKMTLHNQHLWWEEC